MSLVGSKSDGALKVIRGHSLAFDDGKLVTQLGHAALELVGSAPASPQQSTGYAASTP